MRRSFLPMLISSVAVPALLAAVLLPGAAFAGGKGHGPKPVTVICQSLSGNESTNTPPPTIGGCNQPGATGGSGTFSGFNGHSGTLTITWSGTGTTTAAYSSTVPKGNHCPTGLTEVILHGSVTGNTETSPSTDGGVKGGMHTKLCINLTTGDLTLLAGQIFKL